MLIDASLSPIEVEAIIRDCVRTQAETLEKAFVDADQKLSGLITKGEFKKVLDSHGLRLTNEHLDTIFSKLDKSGNNTVRYGEFLNKFSGGRSPTSQSAVWGTRPSGPNSVISRLDREINEDHSIDTIERLVKEKIEKHYRNVVKALNLYDYNRDANIHRPDMRKVLESYCFKFTDQQFEKFWNRYDFQRKGYLNHKDFFFRLGVDAGRLDKPPSGKNRAKSVMGNNANDQYRKENVRPTFIVRNDRNTVTVSLDAIETEFRKKMVDNSDNIAKAMRSFDSHGDGLINLADLRAVLNHFTVPMSEPLFKQLMDRLHIKASHKIAFNQFLEKFQTPFLARQNGMTVPIKPAHKYNPVRGADGFVSSGNVLDLIRQHMRQSHSTRKTFLNLDRNRTGRLSRKDLKIIICERFGIRLTEDQFKELMIILDPGHTNQIDYQKFIELFEEQDDLKGHKWLTSNHRVNKTKPVVLAWETAESIVRDKLRDNWKDVADALLLLDETETRVISTNQLKKIVDKYGLPVSVDHYETLLEQCHTYKKEQTDTVNYVEFFEKLGLDIAAGDTQGLSTQITDGHEHRKKEMRASQDEKQQNMEVIRANRTKHMLPKEVISLLKEKYRNQNTSFRKAFMSADKTATGKISRRAFRELLLEYGMPMSDAGFDELCAKLDFQSDSMNYLDFVRMFDDIDRTCFSESEKNSRCSNHHVNEIRGDEFSMSVDVAEKQLRDKLRENFNDLREAFSRCDPQKSGSLSKPSFRELLASLHIVINNEEFEKLCLRVGFVQSPRGRSSALAYADWLGNFQEIDTPEGHKWLNSCHRYNDTIPAKQFNADELHALLPEKIHTKWKDLAKSFRTIDNDGNGLITKQELRDLLHQLILPISRDEFHKLWLRYDTHGKGKIPHEQFLKKLGLTDAFTSGDKHGLSQRIAFDNRQTIIVHHDRQMLAQDGSQQEHDLDQVMISIKDKVRDHYADMYSAFRKYDERRQGYLNYRDIQRALGYMNYNLSDSDFKELLKRLGLFSRGGRISYEDFLNAFDDGTADKFSSKVNSRATSNTPTKQNVDSQSLKPEQAIGQLRKKLSEQNEIIHKALCAFDRNSKGKVLLADFRRVLDNFCFPLNAAQWEYFTSKLGLTTNAIVDYNAFLRCVSDNKSETVLGWLMGVRDALKPTQPSDPYVTLGDLQESIHDMVKDNFYSIAQSLGELDYAKIGVVGKEDFHRVLSHHLDRPISNEQFDDLWETLPVNNFDNLDYRYFLKVYSNIDPPTQHSIDPKASVAPRSVPVLRDSKLGPTHSASKIRGFKITQSMPAFSGQDAFEKDLPTRPSTRAETSHLHHVDVEDIIWSKIYRNWKDIARQCRVCDFDDMGDIDVWEFYDILYRYNVSLSTEDLKKLLSRYDFHDNGKLCYREFLRRFTSRYGGGSVTPNLREHIPTPASAKMKKGLATGEYQRVMQRMHYPVLENWKPLRRAFKLVDRNNTGLISTTEFRNALRHNGIPFDEEDFFHISAFFDYKLTGKISYNDFIKEFLKNATSN